MREHPTLHERLVRDDADRRSAHRGETTWQCDVHHRNKSIFIIVDN